MIAIPIDTATPGATSSTLFGNAPMFAFYTDEQFHFSINGGEGNGFETARFLIGRGVEKVVYTTMGQGLFDALHEGGVEVYYLGKEPRTPYQIVTCIGELVRVVPDNAKTYLDPGTATGACRCGCDHG